MISNNSINLTFGEVGQHSISHVFDTGPLSELNYRLMIRFVEYVTLQHIAAAKDIFGPIQKDLSKGIEFFEYQKGIFI